MFDLDKMLASTEHRSKIIETFWLFWVFVLIGFDNGILGPCLPDLQASVGATLEQMSYVFFVQGTGALLGNVLGFLLEWRYNRRLLLAAYVLLGSGVNLAIPLVPNLYYLLGMFLLQGITKGLADFGAMSLCNTLWEEDKALPFQFIVVGAGISTFVSPFIAQPFIDDNLSSLPSSVRDSFSSSSISSSSSSSSSSLALSSSSSDSCLGNDLGGQEHTGTLGNNDLTGFQHGNLANATKDFVLTSLSPLTSASRDDIKWPFVIVGVVTLPAALAFLYFYWTKRGRVADSSLTMEITVATPAPSSNDDTAALLGNREDQSQFRKKNQFTTELHQPDTVLLFRVLIIILNIPVFGLLLTFADLLTSMGMSWPLCMSAVEAAYLNTVLWGAAMIGRTVSALILSCVPMFHQLALCSVALVAMGTVLVVCPAGNVTALWFGTAGVGLFATPSMPGFIAWSGDYAPITPFFMNLCLCAAGVGEMVLPFVGGQLMASYGAEWMLVFSLVVMVTMLVLFALSYCVARRIHR